MHIIHTRNRTPTKNIMLDSRVKGIRVDDADIPKVVSYADDVACIIKSDKSNLQRIFRT